MLFSRKKKIAEFKARMGLPNTYRKVFRCISQDELKKKTVEEAVYRLLSIADRFYRENESIQKFVTGAADIKEEDGKEELIKKYKNGLKECINRLPEDIELLDRYLEDMFFYVDRMDSLGMGRFGLYNNMEDMILSGHIIFAMWEESEIRAKEGENVYVPNPYRDNSYIPFLEPSEYFQKALDITKAVCENYRYRDGMVNKYKYDSLKFYGKYGNLLGIRNPILGQPGLINISEAIKALDELNRKYPDIN